MGRLYERNDAGRVALAQETLGLASAARRGFLASPMIQIRKRDLAIKLQKISPHPNPRVGLEQYTVPANLASEILFTACYTYGDIEGKHVLDLGTGTGRLAIGAALLKAQEVVGVDIDPISLAAAARTSKEFNVHVDWILASAENITGKFDTVVMNPPFGTKNPHADLDFLRTGLEVGDVVYSIHKLSTRPFLSKWLQRRGYEMSEVITTRMEIPHQFKFHRKKIEFVNTSVIRVQKSR
ncbi:MAG TPA: METTL5 family protein [Terriglobales bacterium]|nr:METTL5 family protein [Terriglobales bacterium]